MFRNVNIHPGRYEIYYNDRYVGDFEKAPNKMWFFKPLNTLSGKAYTIKELGELRAHLMAILNYN